jgi:hypothetical protein
MFDQEVSVASELLTAYQALRDAGHSHREAIAELRAKLGVDEPTITRTMARAKAGMR